MSTPQDHEPAHTPASAANVVRLDSRRPRPADRSTAPEMGQPVATPRVKRSHLRVVDIPSVRYRLPRIPFWQGFAGSMLTFYVLLPASAIVAGLAIRYGFLAFGVDLSKWEP